jgi:hypothetical protein
MKTTTYNETKAKEVEAAVMQVFNCKLSEVIGVKDTPYKKVVVFILNKLLEFDKRNIAVAYSMSPYYVPTVVEEIELMFLIDATTRNKITEVTKIIGYAYKMDSKGNRASLPFVA